MRKHTLQYKPMYALQYTRLVEGKKVVALHQEAAHSDHGGAQGRPRSQAWLQLQYASEMC